MNDELRNTRFTALKVKDAVCDRLREMRGERPDVDADHADVSVDVRVREGRATISLDLSGESLYHRSYLTPDDGPDAPLSCALAAGLLALAGWRTRGSRGEALVDPACGDGFLVVEAASAACDLAPGLTRERWGFFGWVPSDPDVWNELIDEADERFERGLASATAPGALDGPASAPPDPAHVRFAGASTSSPAIARARVHAKRAGLRQAVSIELADAQSVDELVSRVCAAAAGRAAERRPRARSPACCPRASGPSPTRARRLTRPRSCVRLRSLRRARRSPWPAARSWRRASASRPRCAPCSAATAWRPRRSCSTSLPWRP